MKSFLNWIKSWFFKPRQEAKIIMLPIVAASIHPKVSSSKTRVTLTIPPIDKEIVIVLERSLRDAKQDILGLRFVEVGANDYINMNTVKRVRLEEM